ncbi:MAG: hypothetical protein ABEJ83_03465 [Candidatus Nanohaloarchaea archaeon]
MPSATQCREFVESKSEDLSEDAQQYACGLLRKVNSDPSELPENRMEKLLNRAERWEQGTYGEFSVVDNREQKKEKTPEAEPVEAQKQSQETLE